jgi:hypothetical protein
MHFEDTNRSGDSIEISGIFEGILSRGGVGIHTALKNEVAFIKQDRLVFPIQG